jgi:hypothetical protein
MRFKAIKALQLTAAAVVLTALALGGAAAAEKKKETAPKAAVCNTLTDESACLARPQDCTWVDAVKDAKSGMQKRRAHCRALPKPKPGKKTKT